MPGQINADATRDLPGEKDNARLAQQQTDARYFETLASFGCVATVACLAAESFHVKQPAVSHVSSLFHVEHTEHGFGLDALSRELVSRETIRLVFQAQRDVGRVVSGTA